MLDKKTRLISRAEECVVGNKEKTKNLILVISGPSGSGKGCIIELLIKKFGFRKAVSVTTRKPREGEIDGRDYYFISRERFDEMLRRGELLEYNIYGESCYGTPKSEVEDALENDRLLVLDIDVHGAANIEKTYPDFRSVFIIPPDASEQRRRLVSRGTETEESVDRRMKIARDEIGCFNKYDCVIINETGKSEIAAEQVYNVMQGMIPDQSGIPSVIKKYFSDYTD